MTNIHDFKNSSLTPANVYEALRLKQAEIGFNDRTLELCLWFVTYLNNKMVSSKTDSIPVHSTFIRKICRLDDKEAIRILIKAGIIIRSVDANFDKHLSSEYQINRVFRASKTNRLVPRFYRNDIIQKRLVKAEGETLQQNKLNRKLESNFLYKTIKQKTTFDWKKAEEYINATYKEESIEYKIRFEIIQYLKEGFVWGHYGNNVNRFYSSYNQLPSDLRKFIIINGQETRKVYFDICHSQIQIFVYELLTKNKELMVKPDAQQFFELVTNPVKDFYSEMINILEVDETRETIKALFSHLLYNINTRFAGLVQDAKLKAFYKSFSLHYPNVLKYLRKIKANKEACSKFAIALMNTESDFILNQVAKRLNKEKITVITIHDGFMVNQEHEMLAEMIFVEESIKKFGTTIKFKKEII